MTSRNLYVLILVLLPSLAFGQTAREEYQAARAAEFQSDHAKDQRWRVGFIVAAFEGMSRAAVADQKYVGAFAEVARKLLSRHRTWEASHEATPLIRVGEKRGGDPDFKVVAREFFLSFTSTMFKEGFAPGKVRVPTLKSRSRYYCLVPEFAEQIFKIAGFGYGPGSSQTLEWGLYAADSYMTKRRGCGGEGSDIEPRSDKAFPLYVAIKDSKGMHTTGKILGDEKIRHYVFGGTENVEPYAYHELGHRPSYDTALRFYRQGGVMKAEIRSTILHLIQEAEKDRNEKAADLARKTLAETF